MVHVVEDQDPRAGDQRVEGEVDDRRVRRPPAGCHIGHGTHLGECPHDAADETAGLVVALVERHPGRRAVLDAEPGGDEGGLAGSGEAGHQGDGPAAVVVEPRLEPDTTHEAVGGGRDRTGDRYRSFRGDRGGGWRHLSVSLARRLRGVTSLSPGMMPHRG